MEIMGAKEKDGPFLCDGCASCAGDAGGLPQTDHTYIKVRIDNRAFDLVQSRAKWRGVSVEYEAAQLIDFAIRRVDP
jgi:hypothetical protein